MLSLFNPIRNHNNLISDDFLKCLNGLYGFILSDLKKYNNLINKSSYTFTEPNLNYGDYSQSLYIYLLNKSLHDQNTNIIIYVVSCIRTTALLDTDYNISIMLAAKPDYKCPKCHHKVNQTGNSFVLVHDCIMKINRKKLYDISFI